jgi:FOG: WD40-like repeat
MYALDAETGEERWSVRTERGIATAPTVVDGVCYVGSHDGFLHALDGETGDEYWRFETDETGVGGSQVVGSPVVVDDTVYIGSLTNYLYAIDATTGEKRWSQKLFGELLNPATIVDGTIFVGTADYQYEDSEFVAFPADGGDIQWRFQPEAPIDTAPTVADGTVYFASDDTRVYALDTNTGEVEWTFETGGKVRSSPTVVEDTVIVGSNDESLYALDAATGAEQWAFDAGSAIWSDPTVVDGTAYFGTFDATVHAVETGLDGSSRGSRVELGGTGHHGSWSDRRERLSVDIGAATENTPTAARTPSPSPAGSSPEGDAGTTTGEGSEAGDFAPGEVGPGFGVGAGVMGVASTALVTYLLGQRQASGGGDDS